MSAGKPHYRCSECAAEYELDPWLLVCPACTLSQRENFPLRGVLDVVGSLSEKLEANLDGWLPVSKSSLPSFPVGNTPMWAPEGLRRICSFPKLYLKDDTLNPSGSLKDRASWLVAGMARQHGIREVFVASTGNAGASLAAVASAADLRAKIFIPKTTDPAKRAQARIHGAEVIEVDGNYDDAYRESLSLAEKQIALCRNTALNPLTIEGKKTVSLEIYLQLNRTVPDYVFVPTGDGVILSGVYKGFEDLIESGLTDRMPVIVAVQVHGSRAIFDAWKTGSFNEKPVRASTIAESLAVDTPKNGYHALQKLKRHKGRVLKTTDEEAKYAQSFLAKNSGLYAEPSAAVAFAGFLSFREEMSDDSTAVVLLTGHGLKSTNPN